MDAPGGDPRRRSSRANSIRPGSSCAGRAAWASPDGSAFYNPQVNGRDNDTGGAFLLCRSQGTVSSQKPGIAPGSILAGTVNAFSRGSSIVARGPRSLQKAGTHSIPGTTYGDVFSSATAQGRINDGPVGQRGARAESGGRILRVGQQGQLSVHAGILAASLSGTFRPERIEAAERTEQCNQAVRPAIRGYRLEENRKVTPRRLQSFAPCLLQSPKSLSVDRAITRRGPSSSPATVHLAVSRRTRAC
jgi:hypothetical protein